MGTGRIRDSHPASAGILERTNTVPASPEEAPVAIGPAKEARASVDAEPALPPSSLGVRALNVSPSLSAPHINDASARRLFERGLNAFRQGNFAKALTLMQESANIATDTRVPALQWNIGRCLLALGRHEQAALVARALFDSPESASAHDLYAMAQFEMARRAHSNGDLASALRLINEAQQHAAPAAQAMLAFDQALVLADLGRTADARIVLQALVNDPNTRVAGLATEQLRRWSI